MKKYIIFLCTFLAVAAIHSCSDYFNPVPGENYDIDWPVPNVNMETVDTLRVDTEYTFTGENLDKVFRVFFGTDEAEIIDTMATELIIRTPRLFNKSTMVVTNYYEYSFESNDIVTPEYLSVQISKWPDSFKLRESITLEGTNVDQIGALVIGNTKVPVNGRLIEDPSYSKITLPLTDANVDSTLTKVLLKAVALDGTVLTAADSSNVSL